MIHPFAGTHAGFASVNPFSFHRHWRIRLLFAVCLGLATLGSALAQDVTVSGVVSDADTGLPVEGAQVFLVAGPEQSSSGFTAADGSYQIVAPPGATTVRASVGETDVYVRQLYPGVNIGEFGQAQEIDLTAGDVTGIDFNLVPGFVITGTSVDSAGEPVPAGLFPVRLQDGQRRDFGGSFNQQGEFQSDRLVPADYKVRLQTFGSTFDNPDRHVDQLYDGVPCVEGSCDIENLGNPVSLIDSDVNLGSVVMADGFVIKGTVTDAATTDPVADGSVAVTIFAAGGEAVAFAPVINGQYATPALPAGTYKAFFNAQSVYLNQFFGDAQPCGNDCNPTILGSDIILDGTADFIADIGLSTGGSLSGALVDAATAAGLDGSIELLDSNGQFGAGAFSISGGAIAVDGLPPGTYKALFRAEGYIDQLYSGVACPNFACDRLQLGATFDVVAGQATDLGQVQMVAGATIEGTLTGSDGATIQQASVNLFDPLGNSVAGRRVDENGFYRIEGLPASPEGGYRLKAQPDVDYLEQLYNGQDCVTSCPPEDGDPIALAAGETLTIDMTLQRGYTLAVNAFDRDAPEVPVETACLNVYKPDGEFVKGRCGQNAVGTFTVPGLLPGDYKLLLDPYADSIRFAQTLYDGITCLPDCSVSQEGAVVALGESNLELSLPVESVNVISGVITDTASNPLREVSVVARPVADPDQAISLGGAFDEDGSYALRIPDGEFYIEFVPFGDSERYLRQTYPGIPCTPLACDRSGAQVFTVAGNDIEVNPVLELGARVTGSVARADGGAVSSANAVLWTRDREGVWGAFVGGGSYNYGAVPPGEYWLAVRSFDTDPVLIDQLYEAQACPGLDCDFEQTGDVLVLQAGDDLQIDFALELAPTRTVSGTVLDRTTGQPLAGAAVDVYLNDLRIPFRTGQTDAGGAFSFDLPAGDYGLIIEQAGYITRAFESFSSPEGWCPARRCFGFPGRRFTVAEAALDLGELPMDPGARISGTLSLPDGSPLPNSFNGRVTPYNQDGERVFGADTQAMRRFIPDADGSFETELPPGRWHLLFETFDFSRALVPTALGDRACPQGSCGMETTVAIEVAQGDVLTPAEAPQLAVTMGDGVPLTGSLIDADNGINLDQGAVYFYDDQGARVGSAGVNQQGIFQTAYGFPDGTYYATTLFIDASGATGSGVPPEFVDVLYDGLPCVAGCDVTSGTAIAVDFQAETLPPPIDIALSRGASISGSVLRADDVAPVSARIEVFDATGRSVPGAGVSPEDGSFTIGGLLPGDYYLRTNNFAGLEDLLWNGADPILCSPSCSPLTGAAVTVAGGDSIAGIDFVLSGAGSISGTTTGSDDSPLAGITVEVYNALGSLVGSTLSDETGAWQVGSLPAGRFHVRTRNALGLVNVAWSGLECTGCDVTETTVIELARGEARAGIDLSLDTGASLTGTVTRQADASAVAGVNVDVYNAAGVLLASAQSGSDGSWQVDGLGAGDYRVATRSSLGLVNQVHAGVACVAGCDIAAGTLETLAIGETATIDFALESAASISGTVLDADSAPIADVAVQAFAPDGRLVRQATTGADGSYEIRGLAAGEVFLRTRADGNYTDQTYSGRDCIPVCDVTGSDAVAVTAGQRSEGIDFILTFGGGLAGSVTTVDAAPVSSLSVEIYNAVGSLVGSQRTDANGQFVLRGLPGGRYFARTRNSRGLIDQVFDDFGCTPFPCVTGLGTPLSLSGGLIDGVDFTLAAGNELLGTVTDQFGNPLPTGEIVLYDATGLEVKRGAISDGEWRLNGIADGTYYAVVLNGSGLIDELFEGQPCPGGRCDVTQGTPIVLPVPDPAPELQAVRTETGRSSRAAGDGPLAFELEAGSRIRGVLRAPDDTPLTNATVFFFNAAGEVIGSSETDGLGEFVSQAAFSPGDYYVATTDGETRGVTTGGYVNVVYGDPAPIACPLACDVTQGTPIELGGQFDSDSIVVRVLEGGSLTGRALDGNETGLVGAGIEVYDSQGRLSGTATVGTSGNWRIDGLPDDGYTVVVRNDLVRALADAVVGAGFCDGDCDPSAATATVFPISGGEPDSDVDIILEREDAIFQSRFQAN